VKMWKVQAFQPSLQTYREMIGQWPFSSLHVSLFNMASHRQFISLLSRIVRNCLLCALWNNLRKVEFAQVESCVTRGQPVFECIIQFYNAAN
jgi:hypothetical protein